MTAVVALTAVAVGLAVTLAMVADWPQKPQSSANSSTAFAAGGKSVSGTPKISGDQHEYSPNATVPNATLPNATVPNDAANREPLKEDELSTNTLATNTLADLVKPDLSSDGVVRPPAEMADPEALVNALFSSGRLVAVEAMNGNSNSSVTPSEVSPGDEYPVQTGSKAETGDENSQKQSLAERRRLAAIERLRRLVYRSFFSLRRTIDRTKGDEADFFVVAKYEMPVATRQADLRFEVSQGLETSVDRVSDYLLETPSAVVRDFQVVARFRSLPEAEAGIVAARQHYDQARAYQAQLLSFLQAQQRFQATSMRRC